MVRRDTRLAWRASLNAGSKGDVPWLLAFLPVFGTAKGRLTRRLESFHLGMFALWGRLSQPSAALLPAAGMGVSRAGGLMWLAWPHTRTAGHRCFGAGALV